MLTREQLLEYIDKNCNFHLMEYQKTMLWEFYKKWMTDRDFTFIYGRCNGKMLVYKLMDELMAYEYYQNIKNQSNWYLRLL